MKVKVLALIVSLFASSCYPVNVHASEIDSAEIVADKNVIIINHTPEQIEKDKEEALKKLMDEVKSPRMDEVVEKWEKVSTKTVTKKGIGYAANQKANGTVFSSPGGFYWQDGGNDVYVGISLNFGAGLTSFSLAVSPGKTATTGVWISSPYVNQACKLYIYKDLEITQYKVYRKNKYAPDSAYQFVGYQYTKVDTKDYLTVLKV